jgi:hypothetical protein
MKGKMRKKLPQKKQLAESETNKAKSYGATILIFASLVYLAIFCFLMYVFAKTKLFTISTYLGINNSLWAAFVGTTCIFMFIGVIKYFIKGKSNFLDDILKKFNWYVLIGVYFIVLSFIFSLVISESLIPKNYYFNEKIEKNSSIILGEITCKSQLYVLAVYNDDLSCNLYIKNSEVNTSNLLSFEVNGNRDFNFILNKNQEIYETNFIWPLNKERENIIHFIVKINSTEFSHITRYIKLEDPSIAMNIKTQKENTIYSILMISLSFSSIAIFAGIHSLKQLIEGDNNKK